MPIVYEPHPVTPERKAEIIAAGGKIIDARFAPADWQPEPTASDVPSKSDIAVMKRADLIEWLEAHGVDAPDGSVAEMREQLRAIMFVD